MQNELRSRSGRRRLAVGARHLQPTTPFQKKQKKQKTINRTPHGHGKTETARDRGGGRDLHDGGGSEGERRNGEAAGEDEAAGEIGLDPALEAAEAEPAPHIFFFLLLRRPPEINAAVPPMMVPPSSTLAESTVSSSFFFEFFFPGSLTGGLLFLRFGLTGEGSVPPPVSFYAGEVAAESIETRRVFGWLFRSFHAKAPHFDGRKRWRRVESLLRRGKRHTNWAF